MEVLNTHWEQHVPVYQRLHGIFLSLRSYIFRVLQGGKDLGLRREASCPCGVEEEEQGRVKS